MIKSVRFICLLAATATAAIIFLYGPTIASESAPTTVSMSPTQPESGHVRIAQVKLKTQSPPPEAKKHYTRASNKMQSASPCVKNSDGQIICPPKL